MFSKNIFVILFPLFAITIINSESDDCFRAAVYEHIPIGNKSDAASEVIDLNLNVFEEVAAKASKWGVNILVFAEDALSNPDYIFDVTRDMVKEYAEEIPDPLNGTVHNPCEQSEEYMTRPIMYRLSCLAKANNMYVVADLGDRVKCTADTDPNCPDDNQYMYNTAVAFSPEGYLLAKYHKMQLYYEYYYNVPSNPNLIYFDTPFGRMGLFICFDILWSVPGVELIEKYGVNTMIFPTYWFDELPFVSATQMQQSFAITNEVNVLGANVHVPESGSLGSGIFSGRNGALIHSDLTQRFSKLLIADLPIESRNTGAKCLTTPFTEMIAIKNQKTGIKYQHSNMDLLGSTAFKLVEGSNSVEVCDNGLCCRITYTVESELTLKQESYWFIIANRTGSALSQTHYPICEELCGVALCDDDTCQSFSTKSNTTVFKSLTISAKFSTNYTYPSVTTNDLKLVPVSEWEYENSGEIGSEVTISLTKSDQQIIGMGLYGRCFTRDPPYKQ